jgi:protein TonB
MFLFNITPANGLNSPSLEDSKPLTHASFPGGSEALQEYIQSNLQYPELAREYGIEGEVIYRIRLNANGDIQSMKLVKGIGFGCDEEAKRLIESLPSWLPAKEDEVKIVSQVNLSIHFVLR